MQLRSHFRLPLKRGSKEKGSNSYPFSMEKLHFLMVLFPLLNLQFPSFLLLSSASTLPSKYFINCGSVSNISLSGREFVGDLNSGSFSFGPSSDISIVTTDSSTDTSLYQTARIFKKQSSFDFNITDFGIYYVRVHFFPFSSGRTNLADAHFDVSAFNFSLLSNFRIKDNSNSPLIKEYLLTINATKFSIQFTPRRKSFAFVSAIEVFLVPDKDFVKDRDVDLITPSGLSSHKYSGVRSEVLLTIHRVDVGGPQNNDSLWRNWIPDDEYLLPGESGKKCVPYEGTLNYGVNGANNYSASDLVYKTCRELNLDSSEGSSNSSKITWRFDVSNRATHLVRLHFCDIISKNASDVFFSLSFYGNFTHMISTNEISDLLAAPLYYELVVESDDSGYMDISVGPRQDSKNKTAYLNGVEIMEFMKKSSLVDVPGNENRSQVYVIVGTVCGVAFVFIVIVLFFLGIKYKKAKQGDDGVGSWPVFHGKDTTSRKGRPNASSIRSLNLKLKMPLLEIQDATHNFDPKLLIGEGGFGKVYKGTLQNGMTVAVKRSDPKHGQGLPEFETEVLVLSRIRHRHLVSLIGYCEERSEMILVYEFMEKGTLRDHLYDQNEKSKRSSKRSKLSWKQRLEICIGSAKGLHYLHTCSHGGIIHRDVKSTNILLNKNFVAKVADFGLSRSGPNDPDNFSVGIKGSFGYMDPEYFRSLQFTEKSDVYSFGVVLLEVLCARPAIINSTKREEMNLAEWAILWQKKGQLENIIDPLLVGDINPDSLRKFGDTAEKCLKGDGANRPTMLDVIWDLEYALQLHQTAVHREPHEDTTTNAFFVELPLPDSIPDWEDTDLSIGGEVDGSDTTDSGVFSQLRVDAAR
ncbi:probable receptor-like protein kinase At5g24010 [Juglans microcarpa x Juglans regia]|uniref:probable receptor-like protein kinase At5g24010 n=1 Tax=Juglans microcarpa x Juglans regia TaxID=2249226 RepID=UPI001B7E3FDB|nr:probable receptor-like protein kinase At5g24010 [Juglans microcarpa x Juglans regia]